MEPRDDMAWADRLEPESQGAKKGKPLWVLWAVFYLVLVLSLMFYSVYPVLVHSLIRIAPADKYREVASGILPTIVSDHFDLMDQDFAEAGFVPVFTVVEDDSVPGVKTYFRAYENRNDEVMGLASAIVSRQAGAQELYASHVEFSTYYEGGGETTTSSWDDVYPFRLPPEREYANLPELDDARDLYAVHAWRVDRGPEGGRKFYEAGEALAHFRWAVREEMHAEADTGHLELNSGDGFHTLTWKGAYVAGLKSMWPFEGLVESARDREAERLLEEFRADSGE